MIHDESIGYEEAIELIETLDRNGCCTNCGHTLECCEAHGGCPQLEPGTEMLHECIGGST